MPARTSLTVREEQFIAQQRCGHLAASNTIGAPHVIPVCYAWDGARFWIALDEKPKRVEPLQLKRVRNIHVRGEASLVIDHYDDDWSRLGYVLVSGPAAVLQGNAPEHANALALLRERYPAYRAMALEERPLIAITPKKVSAWGKLDKAEDPSRQMVVTSARGTNFLPLARERRSVRQFTGDPVSRGLVEQVLEAARWAPSPHGRQPWRFAVLVHAAAKERLAGAMGAEWVSNLAMDGQPDDVVALRLAKSRERIVNAPVLVLACLYLADLDHYPDPERQIAEQTMAIQSLGAAIQNLLLAAYAMGLDCGWMCAPLFCPEAVRDTLGLDKALIPHALITLGYAAKNPVRRERRPLEDLIVLYD